MAEIMMRLDGYISPLIPLRTFELLLDGKVITKFKAEGVDDALRIASEAYPKSKIEYLGTVVEE